RGRALGGGRGADAGRGRAARRGEHRLRSSTDPAGTTDRPQPGGRAGVSTWRPPRGVLAEMVAFAREDCAQRMRARPRLLAEVSSRPRAAPRFEAALRKGVGFPLICEVKRSSPSAGAIRPVDAASQARSYAAGGA